MRYLKRLSPAFAGAAAAIAGTRGDWIGVALFSLFALVVVL